MAQNRENKRSFYKSVAARRTKKRSVFWKKNKEGLQRSHLWIWWKSSQKLLSNRTLAAAFAAFSSSAFCLLSIFLYSLKFCVCFCMRERRRRWVFLKRMCKNPKRWWWWWWWWQTMGKNKRNAIYVPLGELLPGKLRVLLEFRRWCGCVSHYYELIIDSIILRQNVCVLWRRGRNCSFSLFAA